VALVFAGDGTENLAAQLAQRLGSTVGQAEFKTFPDGEEYVRLVTDVKDQDVVIVQSTFPPRRFFQLLLMLNACKEAGAKRVRAVVPYLAYARQDRVFKPGEPLSSRLVAECLSLYAAEVITVDAHKDDIRAFYRIPFTNVSAETPIADELKRLKVDVVLAPDAGAMPRAKAVAERIGAQFDYLEKKRITSEIVEMKPKNLDVKGKSVCILDDIISTGGTMAKALEQLARNGAREVYAACVHGLFLGDAAQRLRQAGAKVIVATNTIESEHSRVSVADVVVQALAKPMTARR
jgi:ribose-phosphate pyrophosphokinase